MLGKKRNRTLLGAALHGRPARPKGGVVQVVEASLVCRGLALLPGRGVLSASHDQTLRLWDFNGACAAEFVGHTAIVYSVAGSTTV